MKDLSKVLLLHRNKVGSNCSRACNLIGSKIVPLSITPVPSALSNLTIKTIFKLRLLLQNICISPLTPEIFLMNWIPLLWTPQITHVLLLNLCYCLIIASVHQWITWSVRVETIFCCLYQLSAWHVVAAHNCLWNKIYAI